MSFMKSVLATIAAFGVSLSTLASPQVVVTHDIPIYLVSTTTRGPNLRPIITAPWGSWEGYIATPNATPPANAKEMVLEFDFFSNGYFTSTNVGNFMVGIRSKFNAYNNLGFATSVDSNGIVIGNVTQYGPAGVSAGVQCGAASRTNAVTTVLMSSSDACLLGPGTTSRTLKDGTQYKFVVSAGLYPDDTNLNNQRSNGFVRYSVFELIGSQWVWLDTRNFDMPYDPFSPPTPWRMRNEAGWFITESFSTHGWTVVLSNVKSYWIVE